MERDLVRRRDEEMSLREELEERNGLACFQSL